MAEARTSKRKITTAERRAQAVKLRLSGATYEQIAKALDVTLAAAFKLVKTALESQAQATAADAAMLRQLEDAKLDVMELAIQASVRSGSLGAIDRQLKIMDRRAKLHGLDAPTRLDLGGDIAHKVYERDDDFDPDAA